MQLQIIVHEANLANIWPGVPTKVWRNITNDDIGPTRRPTVVSRQAALDEVSGLVEQVQVVLHRVAVMEALAQTDDPCKGGGGVHSHG